MVHSAKSTTRNIVLESLIIMGIVQLPEAMWPVVTKADSPLLGQKLPKSLLKLADGSTLGVFNSQIQNKPVTFPKEGIACNISYENVKGKNRAGTEMEFSNVVSAEFDSKVRWITENAKAIVLSADLN